MTLSSSTEQSSESPPSRRSHRGLNPDWQLNQTAVPESPDPYVEAFKLLKQKIQEAKDAGLIDSLTNCWTRAYLERFIKNKFDASRDDGKLAIIFIDLNNLKRINDTHGHKVGDELILDFVKFIREHLRHSDDLFRMGGDEFIILCRKGDQDSAFEESLRSRLKTIQAEALENKKQFPHPISFAYGIAVYQALSDKSTLEETIKRADKQMYINKQFMKREAGGSDSDDIILSKFE